MKNLKLQLTPYYGKIAKQILKKEIRGSVSYLDHMCVSVVLPDGKIMMISPIPDVEDHYYSSKYVKHDYGLSSSLYQNFSLYSWKDGTTGPHKNETDDLKESVYNLYSGHFISKKVNDFYFVFGIASHSPNPNAVFEFVDNFDKLTEVCCHYYLSLKDKFSEHTDFLLPSITPENLLGDISNLIIRSSAKNDRRALIASTNMNILTNQHRPLIDLIR